MLESLFAFVRAQFILPLGLLGLCLLGLGFPMNQTEVLINIVLFAFVTWTVLTRLHQGICLKLAGLVTASLIWVFTGLINDWRLPLALALGVGLSWFVNRLVKPRRHLILVIPLLLAFIWSSQLSRHVVIDFLNHIPEDKTYVGDWGLFLRTYYEMADHDYYQSWVIGFKYHADYGPHPPRDVWGWRLPLTFYVWRWYSAGEPSAIYYQMLTLVLLALIASYDIARSLLKDHVRGAALLAPFALYPYLRLPTLEPSLLQMEWWSALIGLFGIWALTKRQSYLAMGLFSVSVLMRELMVIPLVLLSVYLILNKRRLWYVSGIPLLIFTGFLIMHTHWIGQHVTFDSGGKAFSLRFHGQGLKLVKNTLNFGRYYYFLASIQPLLVYIVLAFIGCIASIWLSIQKRLPYIASICFMLLMPSYLIIGTGIYSVSWSALYMPIVLSLSPLILNLSLATGGDDVI